MKFSRFVIAALLTAFLSIASASAQYVRPTTGGTMREFNFNNPMSALAATMVMNKAREDALAKRLGVRPDSAESSANRASSRPASPPVKPVDESSLRFRPTGSYLKTRELADQLGDDPAQRDQYFKLMNAVLDGFGQKVAAAGLQNDVAIALSYFFGENIRIYRGLPELSDQQFINLRNMIASAVGSGGGLGNATDRQKQEMYETLVAYTGITQFGYEQAKQANNEQSAKGFRQVAGQNLQTVTKISPDSINLSGDGLTVSGGTNDSTTPTQPNTDALNATGEAIEAVQLRRAYEVNEVDANARFTGKRIRVVGGFEDAQMENGRMLLHFVQGSDAYANYSLTCIMTPSQQAQVAALQRPQRSSSRASASDEQSFPK